jgi:hypothetical protein
VTIDPAHAVASWFLLGMAALFGLAFALPLLLVPMRWARWFRWKLPAEGHLTEYFGRCLGAVAVAIVVACVRAAPAPAANLPLFELVIAAATLLTAVHVYGALRRAQPWTETAEIALYAAATAATLWVYRGLR